LTLILLGQTTIDQYGTKLHYSKRWNEFLSEWQFCSEEYVCNQCLREDQKLTKGFTRFDSLVVCKDHYSETKKINDELRSIFDNNPNVKVITDLGL